MRNKPVRVTPKLAAKWLTKNVSNRPLSQHTVDRYSQAMAAKEWKLNGDTIRFNVNEELIDGQHRLHACIKSGKPFETYVTYGLPEDAYDTIDQGRPRTMADVLARRGEKNYSTLASVLRYLYMLESPNFTQTEKMRPSKLLEMLEQNPGIRDAATEAARLRGLSKTPVLPGSHIGCLYYVFGKIKPQKNKEFWERVMEGTGLSREMPEYVLRRRLIDNASGTSKLTTEAVFALVIKAWNAVAAGQEIKSLKWSGSEEFPKISGSEYPRIAAA